MSITWKGKAALSLGLSAAMVIAVGGGTAALAAGSNTGAVGTSWTIPTEPMTNTIEKGGKTYKVVTTWANAWSTSGPDFLGISNSSFYGNGGNGNYNATTAVGASTESMIGLWASAANESPNAYNWNSFYNLYVDATASYLDLTPSDTACTAAAWDSASGVWGCFKYRPEIIWTSNSLNATQAAQYIKYIDEGKYYTGEDALEDGAPTVSSAADKAKYYIDGDESYSPYIMSPNNGNPYTFVDSAYELAGYAEEVIKSTASNPGLAAGEAVTWKNMNQLPRSTRYAEGPTDCALAIEKLVKGSMYYTLSQIDAGKVDRKKVAYVAYVPGSNNATATEAVVAVYDYTENIGTGPMDGRASFSPITVDQLATDNVKTARTGSTVVTGADTTITIPYTLYYATADDLATCDVIYSPHNSFSKKAWKEFIQENASTTAAKEAANGIEYIAASPSVCNGSNYTMEKLLYGCFALDCIYPELFPNMELSTCWYDTVFHINTSSLEDALAWGFGKASLPSTTSLGDMSSTYSKANLYNKFEIGYNYYVNNGAKDATLVRLAANKGLNGETTVDITGRDGTTTNYDLNFENYQPSAYWAKQSHEVKTGTTTPQLKPNTITLKTAKKTYKAKKATGKLAAKKTFTLKTAVKGGAKVTYKLSSVKKAAKKFITVKSNGKVVVKKGLKKGTYTVKVKITAAKKGSYSKTAKVKSFKIVIK